jgi:hypothetical protein
MEGGQLSVIVSFVYGIAKSVLEVSRSRRLVSWMILISILIALIWTLLMALIMCWWIPLTWLTYWLWRLMRISILLVL